MAGASVLVGPLTLTNDLPKEIHKINEMSILKLVESAIADTQDSESLREQARALDRQWAHVEAQHRVELDLIRSSISDELIDREANASRISEKQRFLFEKALSSSKQQALDRALSSSIFIESSLASLCNQATVNLGAKELAESLV